MTTIIAQSFGYCAPRSQGELGDVLAENERVKILAGGTDLLVDMRNGNYGNFEVVVSRAG